MNDDFLHKLLSLEKKEDFEQAEVLIMHALVLKHPVYSATVLIKARLKHLNNKKNRHTTKTNGWLKPHTERDLDELYLKIKRLRLLKLMQHQSLDEYKTVEKKVSAWDEKLKVEMNGFGKLLTQKHTVQQESIALDEQICNLKNILQQKKEILTGKQLWMKHNLDVDKFLNNELIPKAKPDEEWE